MELSCELTDLEFELAVRRLATSLRYGTDSSPFLGTGLDYAQSRPFVDGDSVKHIDWRVTARLGRFYVKEYEALKSMPVILAVDTSASMAFSSLALSKYHWAVVLAGGLGLAALERGSPAGVLGCGERPLYIAPGFSQRQVLRWIEILRKVSFTERTRLEPGLDALGRLLHCRGLAIVLSDLHDPQAVPAIRRAAQVHDVVVLQLQDPAERGRLRGGFFRAREAETSRSFVSHGLARFKAGGEDPGHALRTSGIDHLVLDTGVDFLPMLRRYLRDRAHSGQRART